MSSIEPEIQEFMLQSIRESTGLEGNRTPKPLKGGRLYALLIATLFVLFVVRAVGCQYNISGNPDVSLLAVYVSPDSAVVSTSGSLVLTATIQDFLREGTVTWTVEGTNSGTIVSNGLTATYTAPPGLSSIPMIVHVRVSADEDPSRYAICPISVQLPPDTDTLFDISPSTVWIPTNRPQQLAIDSFSVFGTPVPALRWTVASGPGTISNSGLYTPPPSVAGNNLVIVQATSVSDSTLYSQATIILHNYTDSLRCFSRDVLPILNGNCAIGGCHDNSTHQSGYDFSTYSGTIPSVKAGDARNSRLYNSIIQFDANNRMPPPPQSALTQSQVMIIGQWIDQGAIDCQ